MTQHAVAWFDIPTTDFDRAKAFYSAIFDYEMPEFPMGPIRMGIFLHERENGIGGAITSMENNVPSANGTMVYLSAGSDLNNVLGRVSAAGGQVLMEKCEIAPGMGYMAIFLDTEGNRVGLHSMG